MKKSLILVLSALAVSVVITIVGGIFYSVQYQKNQEQKLEEQEQAQAAHERAQFERARTVRTNVPGRNQSAGTHTGITD